MRYPFTAPGLESRSLAVVTGPTHMPHIEVDGEPAPRAGRLDSFALPRPDGTTALATIQRGFINPITGVDIDGQAIPIAERHGAGQSVIAFLPALFLPFCGLLGVVVFGAATMINFSVVRSEMSVAQRIVICAVVLAIAIAAYALLGAIVIGAIHDLAG